MSMNVRTIHALRIATTLLVLMCVAVEMVTRYWMKPNVQVRPLLVQLGGSQCDTSFLKSHFKQVNLSLS